MFSRGLFTTECAKNHLAVGHVLWDTGCHFHNSFISEAFVRTNAAFFHSLMENEDSSVHLANASAVKITQRVRTTLTVRGSDGKLAHIGTTFSIIPMPPGVDVILSLKDMVFAAPDTLVYMIRRAAKQVKLSRSTSKDQPAV